MKTLKEKILDVKKALYSNLHSASIANTVLLIELLLEQVNNEWPYKEEVAVMQGKAQAYKELLKILNGEDTSARYSGKSR